MKRELRGFAPIGFLDRWNTGVMGVSTQHRELSDPARRMAGGEACEAEQKLK